MMGGKEEPCISWEAIRRLQANLPDQVCPRVDLLPENREAAALGYSAAKIGFDHPLWRLQFDIAADGLPPDGRNDLLNQVLFAVGSDEVSAKIVQERERSARRRTRRK